MRIGVGTTELPEHVDVLVVGLGVTGAGVALDAASRGLSVLAVDAFDVAWGTSRWSSKLVHGGLRYLANGQVGVAWESAVERDLLMRHTAPHLTHALPMLIPLTADTSRFDAGLVRAGTAAGDLLRRTARTPASVLPGPRRISAAEATALAPEVRRRGLRGAVLSFDGQLEDDARLVIALARTAASYGAVVRTRTRVTSVGETVALRDETTGDEVRVKARMVINAAGVWAGDVAEGIRLKPSRGTHLVLQAGTLPGLRSALMVPVPGARARYVFVLPQADGRRYVGLTDVEAHGPVPDVPEPSAEEIEFLLDVVGTVLDEPLTRDDVAGAYAGLRPLLDVSSGTGGSTADLSRRHAVVTGAHGMVTVVGGKLTTYRRMAEDAVDAALAASGTTAGPCRTTRLPLLGAAPRDELDVTDRLQRRFGTEAGLVLENARRSTGVSDEELLTPVAGGDPATLAELVFGVTHEGARTVEDLLERRTRVALVPGDTERARPLAERALELAASGSSTS